MIRYVGTVKTKFNYCHNLPVLSRFDEYVSQCLCKFVVFVNRIREESLKRPVTVRQSSIELIEGGGTVPTIPYCSCNFLVYPVQVFRTLFKFIELKYNTVVVCP